MEENKKNKRPRFILYGLIILASTSYIWTQGNTNQPPTRESKSASITTMLNIQANPRIRTERSPTTQPYTPDQFTQREYEKSN